MTRGGHNAKPTALKLVHGTARPSRVRGDEPKPQPTANLTPPDWLDVIAKNCWRKNAPELQRLGLLTVADVNTFALYCQAYSRYRKTVAILGKLDPATDESYRQIAVTVEKAEASLRLFASDFGMNPSSRSRLSVSTEKPDIDPMEELMSGRRTG